MAISGINAWFNGANKENDKSMADASFISSKLGRRAELMI
jgi:hypothetical protein